MQIFLNIHKKIISSVLMFLLFCCPYLVYSQANYELLETAKEIRNTGDFKKAIALLKDYHQLNPDDLNGAWLYAETLYWNRQYKLSYNIYKTTLEKHPENYSLKLDYAIALLGTGELNKSLPLLIDCYEVDNKNTTTLFSLAQLYYWQHDFKKSKQKLHEIFLITPDDVNAVNLAKQIFKDESFILNSKIDISHDDQPLSTITPAIEGSKYFDTYTTLFFKVNKPVFIEKNNTLSATWVRIGNTALINSIGLKIDADAGLLHFPDKGGNKITWDILAEKKLNRNFKLFANIEQKPYFYTLKSLSQSILYKNIDVSIMWNNPNKWNGKASFIISAFDDDNHINTYSAWIMSKPLKLNKFNFKFGYGFNFSSSKENNFAAEQPLSYILNNYKEQIKGIYNPYFTPYKQNVHSLIATVGYVPSYLMGFEIKFSAGVLSSAQNPYLYVDYDNNNEIKIFKDYYDRNFTPIEIGFNAYYNFSANKSLKFAYTYNKNNFYSRHDFSVGLIYYFGKKIK